MDPRATRLLLILAAFLAGLVLCFTVVLIVTGRGPESLANTRAAIGRPFKPQFLKHVDGLDGKRVSLLGYMRPMEGGKSGDVTAFLLTEYSIGCWFCEMPDATGIVVVELKEPSELTRNAIRVEGTLKLNRTDTEAWLVRLENAKIKIAD